MGGGTGGGGTGGRGGCGVRLATFHHNRRDVPWVTIGNVRFNFLVYHPPTGIPWVGHEFVSEIPWVGQNLTVKTPWVGPGFSMKSRGWG